MDLASFIIQNAILIRREKYVTVTMHLNKSKNVVLNLLKVIAQGTNLDNH